MRIFVELNIEFVLWFLKKLMSKSYGLMLMNDSKVSNELSL